MKADEIGLATYDYLISNKFSYRKADGTKIEWEQEDESGVKSKAEAVGMLQRTINFWMPKLANDLQIALDIPLTEATVIAHKRFQEGFRDMIKEPFAQKWQLQESDFTFE